MPFPSSPMFFVPNNHHHIDEPFDSIRGHHGISGDFRTVVEPELELELEPEPEPEPEPKPEPEPEPMPKPEPEPESVTTHLSKSKTKTKSKTKSKNKSKNKSKKRTKAMTNGKVTSTLAPLDLSTWSLSACADTTFYEPLTPMTAYPSQYRASLPLSHPMPPSPSAYSSADQQPARPSLPDLPIDIFYVLTAHAPMSVLARLASTCRSFHAAIVPLLYRDMNLTYVAPVLPDPTKHYPEKMPMYDHAVLQRDVMETLAENPHLGRHVKAFSFTLGLFCSRKLDAELYDVFNLLTAVETLAIDDMPSHVYPLLACGLDDDVFPAVRTVSLRGHMTFYLAEAILTGGSKVALESVDLDVVLHDVPESLWRGGSLPRSEAGVEHLVEEMMRKSKGLKRVVVGGEELTV
ncbi:hypothetical protein K505DRAFT_391733 [Melanomma pulvis-pyrius CBS 109.77]|uniref:F-box domain-containing protein n=1 Tax=Melanomma pulvis-pyrius CBS 109.77 TaxID=1314802 RepID=A0A6A6X169_9PLEO|nr:hypothetical protein K505DRAFT_391733 [Melanomma pulvis-pyrius CBS 109.77]